MCIDAAVRGTVQENHAWEITAQPDAMKKRGALDSQLTGTIFPRHSLTIAAGLKT
jgi:hypothetical protein